MQLMRVLKGDTDGKSTEKGGVDAARDEGSPSARKTLKGRKKTAFNVANGALTRATG